MGNLPLTGDYVVIDFETTGFNPYNDRIIQVAAVRYRNHELADQFVSFVNPERFIPNRITSLTGITNYRVSDAPTIQEVLPLFLAKRYMKHAPNHKLETLKRMLGICLSSHNALDDCITCAAVYQKCAAIQEEGQKKTKKETVEEDEVYTLIKEMLVKHNRDIEWIRNVSVGSYLDIKAFYPIIRVKVKGRKKYVLTEKTEQEILGIYPTLKCEPALKSEIGTTRIMIESIEDFTKLENYILESYDAVMQALNEYKEMKDNADEEIKKYLSITK
ncbi:DNA polymerase III subunit epsilon [Bacillus pseudomycoides]|uniref:exonuclease domain-containing protein n=1 Tax=Bacillus pseudomycoides TaxID=64104 RepID=UPI000BF1A2AF|nr:exonuclease domain-containing protein [Bacillus pseudomycoides]PEJ27820.1 DNA polymerase III subunit epsilon [Bacillus pseudomycoides]